MSFVEQKHLKFILEPAFYVKSVLILILSLSMPYVYVIVQRIMKIVPIWGAIILLLNIRSFKKILSAKFYWILVLFCCSYSITLFLNIMSNFFENTKALIWFIIYIGILLVWWEYGECDKEKLRRDIWQINWIIIGINLIHVIPSIALYIANTYIIFDGRGIGLYESRLFGVLRGLNLSVMVTLVSFIAVLMNMQIKRKSHIYINIIYLINLVLSYIFIIASGTRSVRFAMIIIIAFWGSVLLWRRWVLTNRFKSKALAIGCYVAGSFLILLLVYGGIEISRYPIAKIPISWEKAEENDSDNNVVHNDTTAEIRDKEGEGLSNVHRLNIIKESILLWKQYPLFGIGRGNVYIYTEQSEEDYQYINIPPVGASTHSMPIAVLVYSGICGEVILLLYFMVRMIKGISILFSLDSTMSDVGFDMIFPFVICLSLGIYSLMDTIIVFNNISGTILFWIYLGIMGIAEQSLLFNCGQEVNEGEIYG